MQSFNFHYLFRLCYFSFSSLCPSERVKKIKYYTHIYTFHFVQEIRTRRAQQALAFFHLGIKHVQVLRFNSPNASSMRLPHSFLYGYTSEICTIQLYTYCIGERIRFKGRCAKQKYLWVCYFDWDLLIIKKNLWWLSVFVPIFFSFSMEFWFF